MVESNLDLRITTKNVNFSIGQLRGFEKRLGGTVRQVRVLDTGVGSLGNRLGFVAFQFTFLAGVAGRALQEITGGLSRLVREAAGAEDQVIRAIAQSGLDITRTAQGSAEAIQFMNDAIRDLGSGKTIFDTKQVAEAAREIGRAFSFAGSQEQIAAQSAAVLQANLRLMTIEQINAEKAAVNLSKIMKQFGKDASEANDVVNTLVTVNQQSSITLDGLVRSMSFAGGFAQEFGIEMEELAVILGVIQDRLGRTEGGPGQNFRVLMENLSRLDTAERLAQIGIAVRDSGGQMRPIIDIVKDIAQTMNRVGKEGSAARQAILETATDSIRARTALLNLVQGLDDLERGLVNVQDASVALRLEAAFTETAEARINRLQNSIKSLQIDFVAGLSPAIELIIQEVNRLVRDTGIQQFFVALGKEIGTTLVPIVEFLTKGLTALANTLRQNEVLLSILTKGFVGLVGVLSTLFIIGTIGALVAAMAAGMQRLAAFVGLTNIALLPLARTMLIFAAAGLAVFVALKAIDNIVGALKDGFQGADIPVLALNGALLALSGTALVLLNRFTGLGSIIRGALSGLAGLFTGTTIAGPAQAFGKNAGLNFNKGFTGQTKGIIPGLKNIFGSIGRAGIVGLAIAGAAALGIAIASEINRRVEESPFFQTGLAEKWEVAGFELKAAISSTIREIIGFFASLPEAFTEAMRSLVIRARVVGEKISNAFQALSQFDFGRAAEEFSGALREIFNFGDVNLLDEIRSVVDAEFLARQELNKRLERFEKAGITAATPQLLASLFDVVEKTKTQDVFDSKAIFDLVTERFGVGAFNPDIIKQIMETQGLRLGEELSLQGDIVSSITEAQNRAKEEYGGLVPNLGILNDNTMTLSELQLEFEEKMRSTGATIGTQDEITASLNEGIIEQEEQTRQLIENTIGENETINNLVEKKKEEIDSTTKSISEIEGLNETITELNEKEISKISVESEQTQILKAINDLYKNSLFPAITGLIDKKTELRKTIIDSKARFIILQSSIDNLVKELDALAIRAKNTDFGGNGGSGGSGGLSPAAAFAQTKLQEGGIVTRPTLGLVGEAGPEAVIPLSQLDNLGENITNNISINVEGNLDRISAEEIVDMIEDRIATRIRRKRI